ncbi:MAG: citrate lyase acyl carrier protein [Desulfovibrionaceae bacterium]
MKIVKAGLAGSLESNDCLVGVYPVDEDGVQVAVESIVLAQFGGQIEAVARETLASLGVAAVRAHIQDKGALECTLRARIEAAVGRAQGGGDA